MDVELLLEILHTLADFAPVNYVADLHAKVDQLAAPSSAKPAGKPQASKLFTPA
jgi:hypothetical protein